jgi:hypothetical protein
MKLVPARRALIFAGLSAAMASDKSAAERTLRVIEMISVTRCFMAASFIFGCDFARRNQALFAALSLLI